MAELKLTINDASTAIHSEDGGQPAFMTVEVTCDVLEVQGASFSAGEHVVLPMSLAATCLRLNQAKEVI